MTAKPKLYLFTGFIIALFTILLIAQPCNAQAIEQNWIQDIQNQCYGIDYNTTAEIVIILFPSLYGHDMTDSQGKEINDITQLSVHVLNDESLDVWNGTQTSIGKAGKGNGVLVLVTLEEKQWHIEVGYGLEDDITDTEANRIAQTYLAPAFQDGDYGQAFYDTVMALGEQIPLAAQPDAMPVRGFYYYEVSNTPKPTEPPFRGDFYGVPLWLIIVIVVIGVAVLLLGAKTFRRRTQAAKSNV